VAQQEQCVHASAGWHWQRALYCWTAAFEMHRATVMTATC
jgi:hypothetical protein